MIDSYERRLLLFCQMNNLLIANGRLGDFRNTNGFTFASHNGLSVVDYLLCGIEDSQYIKHFSILTLMSFQITHLFFLVSQQSLLDSRRRNIIQTVKIRMVNHAYSMTRRNQLFLEIN